MSRGLTIWKINFIIEVKLYLPRICIYSIILLDKFCKNIRILRILRCWIWPNNFSTNLNTSKLIYIRQDDNWLIRSFKCGKVSNWYKFQFETFVCIIVISSDSLTSEFFGVSIIPENDSLPVIVLSILWLQISKNQRSSSNLNSS